MKKKLLLLFAIFLALGQTTFADNFNYTYQGTTLHYSTITISSVQVRSYHSGSSDNVVIPDSVMNNGIKYAVTSIGNDAFQGHFSLTSVTIPNTVTFIGNYAFYDCSGLTSVTIPNSVTSIGNNTFSGCSGLTTVTIPNSVTSIGDGAFSGCRGLTTVTISNSVTSIGNYTFFGCSGLISLTIPNSVASIGDGAFSGCSSLNSIVVESGNTHYDSRDNCNAIIQTDFNLLIQGCNSTVIPNTVTAIGNIAFYGCSGLTSVVIPNSVTSIGNQAFYGCSGLTSVTIGNSVTSIGNSAFMDCSNLTSVTIPNSVTFIGAYAFNSCSGLISVVIPNSVTSIGDNTFYHCSDLTSVTIPNSVTSIGEEAFYGCISLTSITIGNSVTSIGYSAFSYCNNLTSIYCKASIPPTLPNNMFIYGNDYLIFVPCGSVSAYQNATHWNNYASHIQEFPFVDFSYSFIPNNEAFGMVNVGSPQCGSNPIVTVTAVPSSGYRFASWSDGGTGNPRTVELTSDTIVVAYFELAPYTITAQPNNATRGTAIVIGNDTVYYGDSVTLVATSNYGYHFQRWQDNNTENPRTVMVTGNKTYTATFLPNSYTVTVHSADSSQGTVSGSGAANYMSNRHITATPAIGHHFSHWSDGDSNASRYITVLGDTTLTAYFAINQYTITIQSNDETRGITSEGGIYNYGDSITLVATANYGYHFQRWQDNNTDNPRTVVVTQNKNYIATFQPNSYTVTLHSADSSQGTVSGSGAANYMSNRHITATPAIGHHFSHWSDGDSNASRDITVLRDTTLIAYFEANRYTVIVITDNNTMGTVSDGGTYDYGDTILIEAFPAEHYHFMHWNDGNRDNPRLYRVENDITLTAFFAIDTHTVHVVSNDIVRGMVESTGTQFAYGTPCTVTATAYTGYVFTGWSNGITANPYTFAVTGDVELTALFEEEGTQAITDIDAADITVYAIEGRIVVRGAEGMEVSIFDVMGREVIRSTRLNETPILPNGIYLIKIASLPARKIIVVR